jgi:Na+/H+ antiporter NhaD/arsenite permease-like protein
MSMLAETSAYAPHVAWVWPFAAILLAIAIIPLVPAWAHWWEHNRNKLLVALVLSAVTLAYYATRGVGYPLHESSGPTAPPAAHPTGTPSPAGERGPAVAHRTAAGLPTVWTVLDHALLGEYVPFIVLLFSLYVIAGGIVVRGDLRATPLVNTAILATGAGLASFIGTTGAAMVLIRFLLKTNAERTRKVHTIIFFIFLVANVGGCLLPVGDPPLFLGYLSGVDFFWTLRLWQEWAFMVGALLCVYYVWDQWAWRREPASALEADRTQREPLRVAGLVNIVWLLGIVVAVATLDPGKAFPGTTWHAWPYLREGVQLLLVVLSLVTTPKVLRAENSFNYTAIGEVACLFVGIFITMQVPIELLQARGAELGLAHAWQFFWASGALSSFLDNAPTYAVYFATAGALQPEGMALMHGVNTATGSIPLPLLAAVSCGSVFMGANTYIGNGPNFMVKAIAEQSGVKMPSFFGYMLYSCLVLIPLFVLVTFVFFRA